MVFTHKEIDAVKNSLNFIKNFISNYGENFIYDNKNDFKEMDIVSKAKKYIREQYQNSDLSVRKMAKELGINNNYFSILFKKKTGINFVNYVTDLRLHFAKYLLNNTDEPIKSVCFSSGFNTFRHFIRVFNDKMGISPSKFRSINKKLSS